MKTLILAAGNSTRFDYNKSKVLYPINNIPLIMHNVRLGMLLGGSEFFIVVNKSNMNEIQRILSQYNIDATYIIQDNPKGISSAVSLSSQYLNEDFILILGDTYAKSPNILDLITIHKKHNPDITSAVIKDGDEDSVKRACTIKLGKNNKIEKIYEKPDFSTGFRGCGLYICNKSILGLIKEHPNMEFTNLLNLCDSRYILLNGICKNINTLNDL